MDLFERAIFGDISPAVVDRFLTYHKQFPDTFELFKRFAFEAKAAGRTKFGAAAICERLRWYVSVEQGREDFKINNDYRSCFARLMVFHHPEFDGFFELRHTPGAVKVAA